MQLSNGRDINFASHWIIPTTWRNIWSTRVELHVKTPFETLQNFHLQAIVGQQEDSDTLATAGIYTDNIQYSMTITGSQVINLTISTNVSHDIRLQMYRNHDFWWKQLNSMLIELKIILPLLLTTCLNIRDAKIRR